MSGINFDSHQVEIPCPGCDHKHGATIGQLRRDGHFKCAHCGETVTIDTSKFDAGVRDVNKSLDNMFKKFSR